VHEAFSGSPGDAACASPFAGRLLLQGAIFATKETIMKRFILICAACLVTVLTPLSAHAYIGLCCGKCGGNMPMNIPNGGTAETYEFRFKLSPEFMEMGGLMDGTHSVDADSLLGAPVAGGKPTGKYMSVPTGMDMYMANLSAGYSFSDRLFVAMMFMWMKKDMDMKFNNMMKMLTGQDGYHEKRRNGGHHAHGEVRVLRERSPYPLFGGIAFFWGEPSDRLDKQAEQRKSR
jgi:hypothetical protein